jgi:hypothetical protein
MYNPDLYIFALNALHPFSKYVMLDPMSLIGSDTVPASRLSKILAVLASAS